MPDEKRMVGDWEVLQGIHVGDKEVVLLHDPHNAETPYAVCYNQRNNSMGIEYTAEGVGSNDYLEMMEVFLHRVQGQVVQVRTDRERTNEPQEVFGKEHCLPSNGEEPDLHGRVAVIRPETLRPEYRNVAVQLILVSGGFGAAANSRGTAVYGNYVFSGERADCRRHEILGILDPEKAPDWVKPGVEAILTKSKEKGVVPMSDKQIRFIDTEGNTLFAIPDGGSVVITHKSGEQYFMKCKYVDEKYVDMDGVQCSYHQLAATAAEAGITIAHDPAPEYNAGYRIAARKPAGDFIFVLGHNPRSPTPWVTWQASRDTPADCYWGVYRAERVDAVADLDRRSRSASQGIPYETSKSDDKPIRFIDPHYKTLFTIPDGGSIVISYPDGEERVAECKYLDECHTAVDGECYHICQFAEIMRRAGASYEPETAPQYVDGWHVVRLRDERDQAIFLGHKPGAELPWATWQTKQEESADMQERHYYSKKHDARREFDRRVFAVRDGRPYVPPTPEGGAGKRPKDVEVPG